MEHSQTMENKDIWDAIKQPPKNALKQIQGGRLKGKSDISPQWRYEAMTEQFGVCGIGWIYTIDRLWNEPASDGQIFVFAQVSVFYKLKDEWSKPIPGLGGSMLISKEKEGLYSSDEGYKMAVTDALGTAMKMLGMAADVYAGRWDGSKFTDSGTTEIKKPAETNFISDAQRKRFFAICKTGGKTDEQMKTYLKTKYGIEHSKDIPKSIYEVICKWGEDKLLDCPKLKNPVETQVCEACTTASKCQTYQEFLYLQNAGE